MTTPDVSDRPTGETQPNRLPQVTLSEAELRALREAGREWEATPPAAGLTGIDADLAGVEERGSHVGDRRVRASGARRAGLEKIAPGLLQTIARGGQTPSGMRGGLARLRRTLVGAPLATRQIAHERLGIAKALAVLSSDALSSVAYATQQILIVVLLAGTVGFNYSLPIMSAILLLLAAVTLSYRQTIRAYPGGGGSYIVASDNLGPMAGLIAGSALMTDYVLTVAVSVSSGVDSIVAAFDTAAPYRVELCVGLIVLIVLGNLRGIRESGNIFAAPTYVFILSILAMLVTLAVRGATGHPLSATNHTLGHATESIGILLVLRAFASGCTALTGVEAISDGVPAFKEPQWRRARITLTIMASILGVMFLGITVAAHQLHLVPCAPDAAPLPSDCNDTIISELAGHAFGDGSLGFYIVLVATTLILVLAANTSFSDFPRLFFFMARDEYAPNLFKRLGDRLAFSNGIIVLGALAIVLVVAFRGQTDKLIPLYTIGVFLAFTMSQAGMVARWRRRREPGWRLGLVINATGMVMTAVVFVITAASKFTEGAWLVLIIIPALVMIFRAVHRHYSEVHNYLATETPTSPAKLHAVCIVPVADLNGPALQSLALARTISDSVIAVHVNDDREAIARLRARWNAWGNHVPLEVIDSQYRALVRPLLNYIDAIARQRRDDTIVVVLPELVATRWWHQILHNQSALRLKAALLFRPGVVVINVPYHLRRFPRMRRGARVRDRDGLDIS